MTGPRLFAVGIIFICCSVAWFVLGLSLSYRTEVSDDRLSPAVAELWGGRHAQVRDFLLSVTTNFDEIDFPGGTLEPA